MSRIGHGLALIACAIVVGCTSEKPTSTDLNPEGPPRILQVFMQERVTVGGATRVRTQLAFGDHPCIPEPGDGSRCNLQGLAEDNREVLSAIARGNQRIRVVFDELLVGNFLEEIACADGSYSRVPVGTTPDDVSDCAGGVDAIAQSCTKVCICEDPDAVCAQSIGVGQPIGVLDEVGDGSPDSFRMIDYGNGELAAVVTCDGVNIPLDRNRSFYNPSGNQFIPAGPIGINGLGPALILVPTEGFRTGATCTISFQPEVVDPDGNQVCAPPGGDIRGDCTPGDTSLVTWQVEALSLRDHSPADGAMNVALTASGSSDATILLQFNAAIDQESAEEAVTLSDGSGTVSITVNVSADDPTIATVTVPGGYAPETLHTVDIDTTLTDIFGGALPEPVSFSFTTGSPAAVPLELVETSPDDGAVDVPLQDNGDAVIELTFSADVDPATVDGAITVTPEGEDAEDITVEVSGDDANVVIVTVIGGYTHPDTLYTVDITADIEDIDGNPLAESASFTFTTAASGP